MRATATNESLLDPGALAEIDERIRRFGATRNPEELWSGLGESERVAAAQEIQRVVASVLRGEPSVVLDPQGKHGTRAMAIAAHTTGLGPILGDWIERDRITTPTHAESLIEHIRHARRRAHRMRAGVLPAIDALLRVGITPVAIKGIHTSMTLFETPDVRRMTDIDLLIPADEAPRAAVPLREAGFVPFGRHDDQKTDWIGPGVSERTHSLELSDEFTRWTLEIHTSLDSVFYRGAVARLDSLAQFTVPFALDGRSIRALAPESLLILLACHCSELDAIRLLRVYEIILLIRQDVDWDHVIGLLRTTGAARFAWPAFVLAEALSPGAVDRRVLTLGERESTWAARHTVRRLTPAGGRIGDLGLLRHLMWARGTTAALQRLRRLFWPARSTSAVHAIEGWRTRIHQLRRGRFTVSAPDERPPR